MNISNTNSIYFVSSFLAIINGCGDTEQKKVEESEDQKMNVLFIAVDDLRPELNCYGASHIKSPNIDQLASEGIQFNRAYCNIPVSGASRTSLLTGTRPTRNTLFTAHQDAIDNKRPNVPTIPGYFQKHGYYNIRNGKITHHTWEDTVSWHEVWYPEVNYGFWRDYLLPKNRKFENPNDGLPYECAQVPDTAYMDGKTAMKAIKNLKKLKDKKKPFFLGVGFYKPHLPFTAPKKYWDIYAPDQIQLPGNYHFGSHDAPEEAFHNFGELRKYGGIPPKGPVHDTIAKNMIHGYYACVSYIDAQLGKLMTALDELGLAQNTIVVLWGDHGWNLGDHGLWCKHCNFETSLHVPLIIKDPRLEGGKTSEEIVEFVDLYPTLCDLCDLSLPGHLEGNSFVNVLKDPENATTDGIAVCRWGDGFTLVQDRYFYTEWWDNADNVYADMLFDHKIDPHENKNIIFKEKYQHITDSLGKILIKNRGDNFDE